MRANAANGVVGQQFNLYLALTHGWNSETKIDLIEAKQWLDRAAAGGHIDAMAITGNYTAAPRGVSISRSLLVTSLMVMMDLAFPAQIGCGYISDCRS
jgi:TPR repeat protein